MLLTALFKMPCPILALPRKPARIVKLLSAILLVGCLQLSAKTTAQGISLSLNNAPLSAAFAAISQQTAFSFVYTNEQLAAASKVTLAVQNMPLDKVLEQLFNNQPLTYSVEDKYIIVKQRDKKPVSAPAPSTEIRGKVENEKGEPVAGASVMTKTGNHATATDDKGFFVLADVNSGAAVIISSIGFESREFIIGNNRYIHAVLLKSVSALDEMVIKGYYSTTKRLNTGTVARVGGDEIARQPVSNPLEALEGRMAGVYIQQTTGAPGGAINVQIRGRNSLRTAGNQPLYIIDEVPYAATTLSSNTTPTTIFGGGGNNPLDYINPSDIESIEVLKDADATAIYGSRGANGVVLISTKKGKAGKTKFDFSGYTGAGKLARTMKLLNTPEYLQMRHEAFNNDGKVPGVTDYDVNGAWDTTSNTDWQKELVGGTATFNNMQASVSGGNAHTQFLLGGGFFKQTTVYPKTFYNQKASAHFNFNHSTDDGRFTINFTASFVNDNNQLPQVDLLPQAVSLAPDAPSLYASGGQLNWKGSSWTNPLSLLLKQYKGNADNLLANTNLSYQLLPGLRIKTALGFSKVQLKGLSTIPINSWDPAFNATTASAYFANTNSKTWIIEPQVTYDKKFGNTTMGVLFGTTFQENILDAQTIRATGFTNDALLENMKAAASISLSAANFTQYRYNAFFGRVNFGYKEKYLLNLTGRRDGSSRFGPGRQFGNFGAVGAAWIFTNETGIKNSIPYLSFGKLRVSYGTTGNDQLGDYQYLSTYSASTYPYQGRNGLLPNRLVNPDYSWETNRKMELALELGFLKDRILLTANYFRNRSSNQLVGYSLPEITGFTEIQFNLPALVQNTGIELELNTVNLRTKNITWKTGINATIPNNKLIRYPGIESSAYAFDYVVGKSLFIQNKYEFLGIDPATGLYMVRDVNADGSINTNDYQFIKEVRQQWFGGIVNNISYKNFSLDMLWQYVHQTGLFPINNPPGSPGNQPAEVLNHWRKPGDGAAYGKYTQLFGGNVATGFKNSFINGDASIMDASFLRLKNISLSWNFPAHVLQKIKMQQARLFIQAQNLVTITHYKGLDPENQTLQQIPPLRVITAGVQFSF